jgi:hypothetical protein
MRIGFCTLIGLGFLAGLAGCSSMSANECMATDWRTVGYEDGASGYSGDRVGKYRKACGKHGITPDLERYQAGREQGLKEFCRPMNGFRLGESGRGYHGVCPASLDGPFVEAYETGRRLYTLRERVDDTADEIESLKVESDRLDASIASAATRILDSALTTEQKAQLLIDSKNMAERKGEIRARIPQLEAALQMHQRDLDDYRSTLSYVE